MACSDSDYAFLRQLVRTHSSNVIDPSRNTLFEARLGPLAKVAGAGDVESLVGLLREDTGRSLHRAVAEAMTINETSFFRDLHPFETLRDHVLPRLIAKNERERRLRIWSAASSTGQEAYSVAMLLRQSYKELRGWDIKIFGTDLSQEVVAYARRGRYRRIEVNRGLPARLLLEFFERDGEEWQIADSIRSMCQFEVANLCSMKDRTPMFDLVLMRNVLLYFSELDRSRVFAEVHRRLCPEGYLLLGNAEQAEDSTDLFSAEFTKGCYFYRPARTEREAGCNRSVSIR